MIESADQIADKTILVTGASGFIGTHLCRRLIHCGARIHAISREIRQSDSEQLQWVQCDVKDVTAVRNVVISVRPQIVFHLASHVVGAREPGAVLPTFYDNLASTVHLLTAITEIGCSRVVLACSSEEPQKIDDTTFPCSPYAAAKLASSIYGRMFYQLFNTPVVMPRIFMTYGPNQKDLQKLVPSVTCQLLQGNAPRLSSGRRLADWIYVDDVVEGLLRAAIVPGIEGRVFDLGSGSLLSVRGIVEHIAEIVSGGGEPIFNALPDRPFEQERAADTSFLLNNLGYRPRVSIREGLEATVAWYRRQVTGSLDSSSSGVPTCELSPA